MVVLRQLVRKFAQFEVTATYRSKKTLGMSYGGQFVFKFTRKQCFICSNGSWNKTAMNLPQLLIMTECGYAKVNCASSEFSGRRPNLDYGLTLETTRQLLNSATAGLFTLSLSKQTKISTTITIRKNYRHVIVTTQKYMGFT